ncbi:hypothetical protein RchiOBHm_Chr1g0334251 [Rosa chinensis]|uniref:Uncharacterized protein n=1 Tax=Rosa chinensis TaxID=74649 RepID=A0A2P6SC92_ROSCH|nr:hypothetical protein RchiOBHm_Chr1g0334251 [Rosa chinensis]
MIGWQFFLLHISSNVKLAYSWFLLRYIFKLVDLLRQCVDRSIYMCFFDKG